MRKHFKNTVFLVLFFITSVVFSQTRQNDTLTTGVIDVVKPYTPSISDAFKVKESPTINDETTESKKEVKYNILSFPVASTFKPEKGKAAGLEKPKSDKLFDNYASLAVGNYTTILGELYLNHAINRTDRLGGLLSHHSSAGGIDGVVLDNDFSNSKAQVNYASQKRDWAWNIEGGYQYQTYNWYGLPENYSADQAIAKTLDVGHAFKNAFLGTDMRFEDALFNTGSVFFRNFSDDQGSAENRFIAKTNFDIPLNKKAISTDVKFDYLGGGFERNYITKDALNYENFQIGVAPTYKIKDADFTLDLGVSVAYLNNTEASKSNFYFYPNINTTYKLVSDIVMLYAGFKGDLIQNSYYDFSTENPFVSPTLFIAPTNQKFNFYLGLNGKLSSAIGYNISGGYKKESNKALFKSNIQSLGLFGYEDYEYGNSFGLVYDNVNTLSLSGELNAEVNSNLKLTLKGDYFSYTTDTELEAWNLPGLKGNLSLDYQINEQWFTGANLFYIGERKDMVLKEESLSGVSSTAIVLNGFLDANVHVGYHVNERSLVYARVNNVANNNYDRWQNFQVQGIQFLVGATIKF